MLIRLLTCCTTKEKRQLRKYLALPRLERDAEQTAFVMERMYHYDCLDYGRKAARNLAGAAIKEFYSLMGHFPETAEKMFIENMIFYMINRDK
jgi:geranylgeranyl diphosphate synthase type II